MPTPENPQARERNRAIWEAGDRDQVAPRVADAGPRLLDAIGDVGPGVQLLDVGNAGREREGRARRRLARRARGARYAPAIASTATGTVTGAAAETVKWSPSEISVSGSPSSSL